ncbi:hypothetical protein [Paraburkholderia sp. C35]|uniref:hypothetical protein n=1 Tax=Paraburkholderia sp. C35 TaxID=2126993 RepID=UPI000D68CBA3|nr:hypothetical protein [Paraburkholderia sp. C35]
MGTKATLAHHESEDGKPSWRLYEELFEGSVVYLQLEGVAIDFTTLGNMENRPGTVVLRLPIETAKQLGMHSVVPAEKWETLCDREKPKPLK